MVRQHGILHVMDKVVILALVFLSTSLVIASGDWTKDVRLWKSQGINCFKNSLSPDDSIKVDQVYYRDTTASRAGLISTETNSTIYVIDAAPSPEYTSFIWSPDSKYLALHDSSNTHSLLQVFYIAQEGVLKLPVPDLKSYTLEYVPIKESDIISSGQVPVEWKNSQELTVKVRLKLKYNRLVEAFFKVKFLSEEMTHAIFQYYTDDFIY